MVDHLLDLIGFFRMPHVEKITFVTLRSLSEFVREVPFHILLSCHFFVQVLDADLIPVRWVNEPYIVHLEEVFLPAENGFEMILGHLAVR